MIDKLQMPKKSNKRQNDIIQFIKNNPNCTSLEILEGLNLEMSIVTLRRVLQELSASSLINALGELKSRKYEISNSYNVIGPIDVDQYFKKEIDDQIFLVNLIYQTLDDIIVMRLICTYLIPFKEPGKDFYQIVEKLSSTCLLGYFSFAEEDSQFFISYNSQYVSKAETLSTNDSFETHLKVSFDMIGMNYHELFDKK